MSYPGQDWTPKKMVQRGEWSCWCPSRSRDRQQRGQRIVRVGWEGQPDQQKVGYNEAGWVYSCALYFLVQSVCITEGWVYSHMYTLHKLPSWTVLLSHSLGEGHTPGELHSLGEPPRCSSVFADTLPITAIHRLAWCPHPTAHPQPPPTAKADISIDNI